jgi:hypothetical protein
MILFGRKPQNVAPVFTFVLGALAEPKRTFGPQSILIQVQLKSIVFEGRYSYALDAEAAIS